MKLFVEDSVLLNWDGSLHVCVEPQSSDFQDGSNAAGCWIDNDGLHYKQVVGNSGVYLIVTDPKTGEVVRDDRPWQMKV